MAPNKPSNVRKLPKPSSFVEEGIPSDILEDLHTTDNDVSISESLEDELVIPEYANPSELDHEVWEQPLPQHTEDIIEPSQSQDSEESIVIPESDEDLLEVTPITIVNRIPTSSEQTRDTIKQGEEEMAEVDTTQLSQEHGSIRHDVAVAASNIRADIGKEACAINTHIGDSRRETEAGFANTRYNLAEQAHNLRGAIGDVRQEQAENFGHTRRDVLAGFGDTRYNLAERTGDIRRELAQGFDKTNDNILISGSDIRREAAEHTNEIVKEGLKGTHEVFSAVRDNRYDLASRIENAADRNERAVTELRGNVADRFFAVGRDLADIRQGQATLSKDIELNALKGIIEGQKNTQYLADKIAADGEKTRALLNDHKYHDLNRALVERQTELVNCEQDRWHHRDRYWDARWGQHADQWGAQFAAMQNQLQSMNQNFNSQLAETRQGMVNFGTMAGVGQSSTSNNVR